MSSEAGRLRFVPSFRPIAMTTPLISQAGTEQGSQPSLRSIHTQIHTYQMDTHTYVHTYVQLPHLPKKSEVDEQCEKLDTLFYFFTLIKRLNNNF